MKFLWISGWAVPPVWLAALARREWPDAEHTGCTPSGAENEFAAEKYDAIGGYSLGALWLMRHAERVPVKMPVILLAPVFAFTAEQGSGGRVALAQLRLQRRRLRASPRSALIDFSERAGLAELFPVVGEPNPEALTALDEELGWLETWQAPPPASGSWQGFVGEQDALLDAVVLKRIWPALEIVPGATHAPAPLLRAAKNAFLGGRQP